MSRWAIAPVPWDAQESGLRPSLLARGYVTREIVLLSPSKSLFQTRKKIRWLFAAVVLLFLTRSASAQIVQVTTIAGEEIRGVLAAWTSTGVVVGLPADAEAPRREISGEQLLRLVWDEHPAPLSGPHVLLRDGTRLPIQDFEATGRQARLTSPLWSGTRTLPAEQLQRVQLIDAGEDSLAQRLNDLLPKGDVLAIKKKRSGKIDYLSGVIGDVTAGQVDFKWDGERIPVKRSKVAALAYFNRQPSGKASATCWLTTVSGAQLPVTELEADAEKLDESRLQLTLANGWNLELPLADVVEADFSAGKLAYLSDLEPVQQVWTPHIGLPAGAELIAQYGAPRRDQSFTGSALTLAWPAETSHQPARLEVYQKGLALRSRTELRYRLPAEMRRFRCWAGLDPATAEQGNVTLSISTEQQLLWEGEIAGGAAPVALQLELEGAHELHLVVDYGKNSDFGDRLHLVQARVSK